MFSWRNKKKYLPETTSYLEYFCQKFVFSSIAAHTIFGDSALAKEEIPDQMRRLVLILVARTSFWVPRLSFDLMTSLFRVFQLIKRTVRIMCFAFSSVHEIASWGLYFSP